MSGMGGKQTFQNLALAKEVIVPLRCRVVLGAALIFGLASCKPDAPSLHVASTRTAFHATLKQSLFSFGLFKTSPCLTKIEVWQNGKPIWIAEATGDPCSSLRELDYSKPVNGFRDVIPPRPFDPQASATLLITSGLDYCYRFTLPNQPTRCESLSRRSYS